MHENKGRPKAEKGGSGTTFGSILGAIWELLGTFSAIFGARDRFFEHKKRRQKKAQKKTSQGARVGMPSGVRRAAGGVGGGINMRIQERTLQPRSNTLAPLQAGGGGLTPLRGKTAARPSFFLAFGGLTFYVFGELGDICKIWGQVGTKIAPRGGQGGSGEPLGPILEAKWWPRRRQKRPKRGGKATQGAKKKTQEVPQDSITTLG